jgi:hypothetical protein
MNKIEPAVDNFNKGVVKQFNIIKNNSYMKMFVSFVTIITIIYVFYKTYSLIIEKADSEPFILNDVKLFNNTFIKIINCRLYLIHYI